MRLSIFVAALIFGAPAHASSLRLFSYDPADSETRHASGAVTFEFSQRLIFTTVLRVLATEGEARADLKPAKEDALGRGGLSALIGTGAPERDLYEVQTSDEGPAMIAAFCPGAKRAWMSFGRLKLNRDLRVFVIGDDPAKGGARLCRTLAFNFHGEWRLPADGRFDERQLERPLFPH